MTVIMMIAISIFFLKENVLIMRWFRLYLILRIYINESSPVWYQAIIQNKLWPSLIMYVYMRPMNFTALTWQRIIDTIPKS